MEEFGNTLFDFAQRHYGVIFILFGVLLIVAAIRDWRWLMQPQGTPSMGFLDWMYSLFGYKGYRIGTIIIGVVIILCGVFFAFMTYSEN